MKLSVLESSGQSSWWERLLDVVYPGVCHLCGEGVKYGGEAPVSYIYFTILISHILLAGISLPFILITLALGHTNHFAQHKKMARWVFPIWLYVAATGPIVYLMMKPYY